MQEATRLPSVVTAFGDFKRQTGINSERCASTDRHHVIGQRGDRLSRMPELLDRVRALRSVDFIEDPDQIGPGKNQNSTMTE